MVKYRKKPVVIEAVQFKGDENLQEIIDWLGDNGITGGGDFHTIRTLEGDMKVSLNDFVIKGIAGEFYPCKNEIFLATYEKVED